MDAALTLDGISKRYGGFQAVSDLSFQVEKGSICGFLGPNGAGKTSTLRMILGLQPATSGRIEILGAPDGRLVRDRIGFLPEERGLYKKMTPVDAIAFFGALKGLPQSEGKKRARDMLEQQGLGASRNKKMKELSKGMAQKVQLIASVVHRPEFVILDEPFSGLDPEAVDEMFALLTEFTKRGVPVLFSSHQLELVERLCDQIVILRKGQVIATGSVDELRSAGPARHAIVADADLGWLRSRPGVVVIDVDGPKAEVEFADDSVAQHVLAEALSRGPVRSFGPIVRPLSDYYREVTR